MQTKKGIWETVNGEITIFQHNPDTISEWRADATYKNWDLVKHDLNGTDDYLIYRCLADGTKGGETEPPNNVYWARNDNPQLGNFGIYTEKCSSGYFLVDNVVLSTMASIEDGPNSIFDPKFDNTSSSTDFR